MRTRNRENQRGGASLLLALITGTALSVGLVSLKMAAEFRNRRLVQQMNGMEGFYQSEIAAWSMYRRGVATDGEIPVEITDSEVLKSLRRYQPGSLKGSATATDYCGTATFNPSPTKYQTCLVGAAPSIPLTTPVTSCPAVLPAPPPIPATLPGSVIFVTGQTTKGDMNSVVNGDEQWYSCPGCNWDEDWPYAADLTCRALAHVASASNPAIAGRTWKAVQSIPSQNAKDKFILPGDILNTRGQVVATTANGPNGLFSGNLFAPVRFDERGNSVPCAKKDVWTASSNTGNYLASSSSDSGACTKWYISNSKKVVSGTSHFTNALLQDLPVSSDDRCDQEKRLLCVSQTCSGTISFENPFRIRTFVNQASGTNVIHPQNQAPFYDLATAQKVCELTGYPKVISYGSYSATYGRNGYDSASGSCFKRWNPGSNSWVSLGPSPNTWLSQLTCGCN